MKKKVLHPSERVVFGKQKITQNISGNSKLLSKSEIASEALNCLHNFPQFITEENNSFGGGDFGGGGSGGDY